LAQLLAASAVVPPSALAKVTLNWRVTFLGYTKKTGYTRGGTTSQSKNEEDENWFVKADGTKISIVPKPLVQVPGDKPEANAEGTTPAPDANKEKSKCTRLKFKFDRVRGDFR
jgi:hypothetical protein